MLENSVHCIAYHTIEYSIKERLQMHLKRPFTNTFGHVRELKNKQYQTEVRYNFWFNCFFRKFFPAFLWEVFLYKTPIDPCDIELHVIV